MAIKRVRINGQVRNPTTSGRTYEVQGGVRRTDTLGNVPGSPVNRSLTVSAGATVNMQEVVIDVDESAVPAVSYEAFVALFTSGFVQLLDLKQVPLPQIQGQL